MFLTQAMPTMQLVLCPSNDIYDRSVQKLRRLAAEYFSTALRDVLARTH